MSAEFLLPPPNTLTVADEPKRHVLYDAHGTPLVRPVGFVRSGTMAQTSGTFPQLTTGGKRITSKKGGRRG